jgi:hypothetical protein
MADTAPAKAKIPPKPQPPKKKKKNAPDKPQPAWLFPPDEENPVLNPKPKTDDDTIKETQEREKALNYMKRRVHAVPDRPAPPPQLLTLVGIFLTDFGFNSTSRLFTNERKARQELNGWEDAVGKKIEKGTPTLETIYRNWYREWKIQQKDETSSDESGSETSSESDSVAELSKKQEANSSGDDDSEASTDGLGGSDVEMKGAPKGKKGKAKNKRMLRPSSSPSTTSESDADDEDEKAKAESTISKKAANTAKPAAYMPAVDFMAKSLKRKAASAPSDSSDSASSADKERLRQKKKVKTTSYSTVAPTGKIVETKPDAEDSSSSASSSVSDRESMPSPEESNAKLSKNHGSEKPVKAVPPLDGSKSTSSSSSSSSSSSASESNSDSNSPLPASKQRANAPNKITAQPPSLVQAPSSDSSATINGDSKKPSVSISSASDRSSATSSESSTSKSGSSTALSPKKKPEVPKLKKKHEGAQQTPLASLSASAAEHSYISNKYQNYEYAERAYKDLSVTRGKGFTKEKNKKKRGSYRGGAIDTAGGKSFKFAD